MRQRYNYWKRITQAYLLRGNSHLTFWHEMPEINERATYDRLGPYYMTFSGKAAYPGPFDCNGVPLLNYQGSIGTQYNPIAIAQYGLAHYNRYCGLADKHSRDAFLKQADWLVANLEPNRSGLPVWNHHFDFEYCQRLRSPWYSGLAQGQGISLLARAYAETRDAKYLEAMKEAFVSLEREIQEGGVLYADDSGGVWIEEYIVDPPTHILNGFIWALWGIYDYGLSTNDFKAAQLFSACNATLERNLHCYDTGFWSLYELSGTSIPMIASSFYHRLHSVQLEILHRMTGKVIFRDYSRLWEGYRLRRWNQFRSLAQKCAFKVLYY